MELEALQKSLAGRKEQIMRYRRGRRSFSRRRRGYRTRARRIGYRM